MSVVALVSFGRGTLRAAGSGTTQQDAGVSCKAILVAGLSSGDGVYWIDPNGGDHADAFEAYCDMTTDGGGWTLAVNSVAGEEPVTNDMTSNTGVPGIDRGHTRDLTNLAINNDAQIRYYIDDPSQSRLFHAKFTGRYHNARPAFASWLTLPGHLLGSDTLLSSTFARSWSTTLSDRDTYAGVCPALFGNVPWHYSNCWTSIPTNQADGSTQGPVTNGGGTVLARFSIFVREVGTIPAFPDPASPAKFGPAVNLPTGTGPGRVAAGDFDQDGRPDAVTVNPGNNTVTVRFSGGGVTQFAAGLTEFPPGSTHPDAIAVGHFNADSRLDLVVTYSAAFSRAVVFENTGSGFAPMTTITGCLGFGDIEAADFDGNGTTDLAYHCQSNPGVGLALGNGDGTFTAGPFIPTSLMAPNSLAVADFNGDARPDIIGFSGSSGCVAVMLNLGFGSFSSTQQCLPIAPMVSGAIGDLNNDTRPDVVVTTSGGVQVLQNLTGTQFSPGASYPLPAGAGDVAIRDVNNDGRPDVIAVPNTLRAVAVYSGNGDLTLQLPAGFFNVSSPPRSLAVADFDGDGLLDLASADNATDSVSLLYNSFSVNYAPIASDGAITVIEGTTGGGTLTAFDPNGEAVTFALVTNGSKGTATLTTTWPGAFTYTTNAGANGTDTVTFTASDGVNTSNVATITVTIGPKQTPQIFWLTPAPIRYGTPLGAQLNAMVNLPGTYSFSPTFGTVLSAGLSQTLTVTFTPMDTAHYTAATKSVSIDVLPAPLVVRTNDATSVFGQPLPAFGATFAGFVNGDTPASLGGTLTFTGPWSTNAGSYPIMPGGVTSSNYALDFQPGTLTINPAPTTTALSASSTAVAALQPFTLTATVGAVAPGTGMPTGTVTFFDGAMRVGTANSSGGVATLTVTGHIPGAHAFTATYDGGGNFAASTSAPAGVTVRDLAQSTLTFAYPLNGQQFFGLRVTLGAMVIALGGGVTPTGSVAFLDGGTLLGTAPLSGGVAHLSTNALPAGPRFIFAVYLGNATLSPSVSSPAAYNVYTGTAPLTVPMTLTSPVAPTPLGDPMTFHVAFVPLPGNETPTGTVVFLADNTLLGTAPISIFDGLARAELTTSALSAGIHLISAIYVGDGVYGAIAAGPVLRQVQ